jgi:hypothetical protein
MASQPLRSDPIWVQVGDFAVRLHDLIELWIEDIHPVRSVICDVEYRNDGNESLDYGLRQWQIYDTTGHAYEFELVNRFYQERAHDKLATGILAPGRRARGLVAFHVPANRTLAYLQFRPNFTTRAIAEFPLG